MQRPYDKNLQNSWYKAYLVDTGVLETAEKGNGYNDKYDHAYNYCSTGQIYIENKTEAVDYAKCPYEAEVNVTLTDNDEIKKAVICNCITDISSNRYACKNLNS